MHANNLKTVKNHSGGEVLHRNGDFSSLYSGHAGLIYAHDTVSEVVVGNSGKGDSLRDNTVNDFIGSYDFYGAKSHKKWETIINPNPAPSEKGEFKVLPKAQLSKLVKYIQVMKTQRFEYDGNHLNQKGQFFAEDGGYWEFDCVGWVEHVYEKIGYNLTPNSLEEGFGWPLSVREQRDSKNVVPSYQ